MKQSKWVMRVKLVGLKCQRGIYSFGVWLTKSRNQKILLKKVAVSAAILALTSLLSACDGVRDVIKDVSGISIGDTEEMCYAPAEPMRIADQYEEGESFTFSDGNMYNLYEAYDYYYDKEANIFYYNEVGDRDYAAGDVFEAAIYNLETKELVCAMDVILEENTDDNLLKYSMDLNQLDVVLKENTDYAISSGYGFIEYFTVE